MMSVDKRHEQYQDYLVRLFPEENRNKLQVGGNFVRNITFQVTEACNMRCTYCYQHDKTPRRMSFETGKKFIDLILASDERSAGYIKSRECPGVVLEFIGGEPFLEIDLIDRLTDYFLEQCILLNHPWATRYRISFSSNGLLYFDEKVQKYLNKHKGQVSLGISIDGNKQLHDMCRLDIQGNPTYDRAIAAADDWAKQIGDTYRDTKLTFSPDNIVVAGEALIDMIKHGYLNIHCNCVYEKGWEVKHATILYNQLKQAADYILDNNLENDIYISILDDIAGVPYPGNNAWCGGSGLMMCCAPDGNIYPCLRYAPSSVGQGRKNYVTIGNVDDGFLATPEQIQNVKCFSCVTRKSQVKGTECENCPIAAGCGDCAGYSWEVTGKIGTRVTYYCVTHKARCLAMVYYKNKKAIKNNRPEDKLALNCPEEWAVPIIGQEEYNKLKELAGG